MVPLWITRSCAVIHGRNRILIRAVTSDTAAAHLAGSLGRPTLLLLKRAADWRWLGHDRVDTPWYPTLRLFRQSRAGVWDDPVAAVAAAVAAHRGAASGTVDA